MILKGVRGTTTAGGKIYLLLGSDHLYLLNPIETREGGTEEPCAVKPKWTGTDS